MTTIRTAALTWAYLVEPGDQAAGTIVSHLGLVESHEWLKGYVAGSKELTLDRLMDSLGLSNPRSRTKMAEHVARWQVRWDRVDVDQELKAAQLLHATIITRESELWPVGLNDLMEQGPFCLWILGSPQLARFGQYGISIVGARAATAYGEHVTANLASQLVDRGHPIMSGGAYGVDAVAHRATLAAQGHTAAVMAGGIDQLYPAGNVKLLQEIVARGGSVVAEQPPGSVPSKVRFLRRNRLIAALTKATVVVEAGWRSGTLSTANHAFELGRPVGAVPGPITSAQSAGCHRLLSESFAQCVTSAQEIAELAGFSSSIVEPTEFLPGLEDLGPDRTTDSLNPLEKQVFDALSPRALRTMDQICANAGVTMPEAMGAIANLDGRGIVERVGFKWRRLSYRN